MNKCSPALCVQALFYAQMNHPGKNYNERKNGGEGVLRMESISIVITIQKVGDGFWLLMNRIKESYCHNNNIDHTFPYRIKGSYF